MPVTDLAKPAALKNKRLSQYNRDALLTFAGKQIAATANTAVLDAAYEASAQSVHDAMVERFPVKDMKVLARYDAARADACIYVSTDANRFEQFCFRDDDARIPFHPGRNCNRNNAIMLDGARGVAFDTFLTVSKAHAAEIKKRLNDFKALIYGAQSFNEVVNVWPAADVLRSSIVGTNTALSVLSNDVVSRIQADAAAQIVTA